MGAAGYLSTSIPLRLASAGSVVAIPILAVQQLDDIAVGGALVAASLAPAVVVAPLVGAALDRAAHPRRLVFVAGLVTAASLVAASAIGWLPLVVIAVLLVIGGGAAPFYLGGLSAFVAEEISNEHRAYAFDALSYNIASVGGPALVAVTSLSGSARSALWAMAACAAVGAFSALALKLRSRPRGTESVLQTIAAGARHLTRHRPLSIVIASGTVSQFAAGGLPIAAIALSLERAGTAGDAAIIVTAFAIGGLLGALAAATRPSMRFSPQLVMGASSAIIGLVTLGAVANLGMPWTVVVIGLSGVLTASNSASMLLLRKQQSPVGVRSQVFTIGSGLRSMSGAAGAAVAGALAGLDAGVLIAGVGVVWLLGAAVMLGYPRGAQLVEEPTESSYAP